MTTHVCPRVAIGGIMHETHTFMPRVTTLADFENGSLKRGGELLRDLTGTRSGIGGMIDAVNERDWQVHPTLYATAMPAGTVDDGACETLLDDLLRRLQHAMPLDGVLLALHGAMVSESQLDAETYILESVRGVVGESTPIVVLLDMHGNISPHTVELADVTLAYDTNPHIDTHERGREAVDILARLMNGEIQPAAAIARPALLLPPQRTDTDDPPLSLLHERAAQMEAEDAIICIAVLAGFAYADTPFTGPSVIVTSDGQPDLARSYADELSQLLSEARDAHAPRIFSAEAAVELAAKHTDGPVILVDSADNIGGGTPGDGTDALRAMLDFGGVDGAIVIADAEAVAACVAAAVGAEIALEVGGKSDCWHGEPVQVSGRVRALSDGVFEPELADNHFASFYGDRVEMGSCAWLRVDGVNILLTERKTPPMDLNQLRHIGIVPEAQKMIVVKSAVAYRAAYMPIAGAVIEMDTAGLCSANLERFPYRHLRRPVLPLDVVD